MKVTERGIQVLKGQESVYRKEPKKVQQLSDEETDTLFEVLRELRTDLASEAGVPRMSYFRFHIERNEPNTSIKQIGDASDKRSWPKQA